MMLHGEVGGVYSYNNLGYTETLLIVRKLSDRVAVCLVLESDEAPYDEGSFDTIRLPFDPKHWERIA